MRRALQKLLLKYLHHLVAEGNAFWYEKGFTDGKKEGRTQGFKDGWNEGFQTGINEASPYFRQPYVSYEPTPDSRNTAPSEGPDSGANQGNR